jgi:hypothetical protein
MWNKKCQRHGDGVVQALEIQHMMLMYYRTFYTGEIMISSFLQLGAPEFWTKSNGLEWPLPGFSLNFLRKTLTMYFSLQLATVGL